MDRVIEKKRNAKFYRILPFLGLFLLGLLWYSLLADTRRKLNISTERLQIAKVIRAPFQEFIIVDALVQPRKSYYLDIIEAGVVEKIMCEAGAEIEAGDTILKLSNSTLQLDYMSRESQLIELINERQTTQINMRQKEIETLNQLAEIEYLLKKSELHYRRNQQLIQNQQINEDALQESKLLYEYQQKRLELAKSSLTQSNNLHLQQLQQLDASIRRMQRHLRLSESTLNNLYLIAPQSGQLSSLNAQIGEVKQVGENIGQIDQLAGFLVRAKINEHYISRVQEGMQATLSFGEQCYTLKLHKLYPEVNKGVFSADLLFIGESPQTLRRGQSLQIKISLSDAKTATLLPRGAFYQSTGGQWIFVVNPNKGIAERRNIQLGRQNPWYYEIVEGLEPNEKVIISHYELFEEIDLLNLKAN